MLEDDEPRMLVYEVKGGRGAVRLLDDLMDDISYAVGTVRRGPGAASLEERLLHTGLLPHPPPAPASPATTAPYPGTDLHAVMVTRSDRNTTREVDEMSAVYEFFQVFGDLWYNALGIFS